MPAARQRTRTLTTTEAAVLALLAIEGERGGFYFPIVTMIVVSIVLTVLFNLFLRR